MANKNKRSLEDAGRSYKYILDDDEQWHRIGRDNMTRAFEELVVMPKGNKYKYVPKTIDNSEKEVKARDKMLSRQYTRGLVGEPGLELTYPELDLLLSSSLVKDGFRALKNRYGFVKRENSFTRGIGGKEGLDDLIESGVVRGNPVGTEVSANTFRKYYRRNRDHFRDIMNDTGRKGIAQRYYNRTLSEEDFKAIKASAKKYEKYNTEKNPNEWGLTFERDTDPLSGYSDYIDYMKTLKSDKQSLINATSIDESGQPLAYFYDDGRNPISKGYDYARSQYGVRVNNASSYNPKIFLGHEHYSFPKAISITDPNVEIFRRGPFGITLKMDKNKLIYGK